MPLMNFIARSLPAISATWLNAVDVLKFTVFADAATKQAARAALSSDLAGGSTNFNALGIEYVITPQEILAGVTIVNKYIPSHTVIGIVIVDRYGVNTTPGTTDMYTAETAAQSVIAQLPKGGVIGYFATSYYSSDTILVYSHRTNMVGLGKHPTNLTFNPTSSKARLKLRRTNTAEVLYQCAVKRMCFEGFGTEQKIAIDAYDISETIFEELASRTWTGNSGSAATPSIGIRTAGREFTTFRNLDLYADRPMHVMRNGNAPSLSSDHTHFEDIILSAQVSTEANILIDADAGISNWTCDGYLSLIGGKYGLRYMDGTEPSAALNVKFGPGRFEQPADDTGFAVDWNCSAIGLEIHNFGFGGDAAPTNGGLRIRNVSQGALLINTSYSGTGVALDIDNTSKLQTVKCFWQTGSTASMSGMMVVSQTQNVTSGPVPETGIIAPTGYYEDVMAATVSGYTVTIANDGVYKLGGSTQLGYAEIIDQSTQVSAVFSLSGTNADTNLKLEDPSAGFFTVTADNATTRNCYWHAGSGEYRLQNKTGSSITFRVKLSGRT